MTALSARAKKQRLLRVFERTGGSGVGTRPFDSLTEEIKDSIRSEAMLAEEELPILVCYQDEGRWLLLTSERLITKGHPPDDQIGWAEILDATVADSEVGKALSVSENGKLTLIRLRIVRANGSVREFEVESGRSFMALWNVLKTVAVMSGA